MRSNQNRLAVVAIALAMFAGTAYAGSLNLNDVYNGGAPFVGSNYMWIDVVETNGNAGDPAVNYYQDPLTVGDTFIVNPTNFRVDVTPGPGSILLDSQLEMIIMGTNGQAIPQIMFSESGDYEVLGFDPDAAFVKAEVNYFWQVLEGGSAGTSGMGTVVFEDTASPNDSGLWTLAFDINLPDDATKVRFEYDNRLSAQANSNTAAAFIAKKLIDGITISVPEPSAFGLIGAVVASLLMFRRRWDV